MSMKDKKEMINPLELAGRSDGMTVPEGYFADFAARMEEILPERNAPAILEMPRSRWQKMRPYVYLAAMFAGIWCMLQMFALMGGAGGAITPDSNPVLAEAISDDTFMDEYYGWSYFDEAEMMDDLYASGLDVSSIR